MPDDLDRDAWILKLNPEGVAAAYATRNSQSPACDPECSRCGCRCMIAAIRAYLDAAPDVLGVPHD